MKTALIQQKKIIKFGGRSLANGQGINRAIDIVEQQLATEYDFVLVLSARGKTTDSLQSLLDMARNGENYFPLFEAFKAYQLQPFPTADLREEFQLIGEILQGVQLTKDYSDKINDLILAQGELLSVKLLASILQNRGVKCQVIDSRRFLRTDDLFGNAKVRNSQSEVLCRTIFSNLAADTLAIVTGYIAENEQGDTTTLGRNGSNYSASLLASYLNASEIISYTHVDGIFTANPEVVKNASLIKDINYTEASELASFGASILHSKTIAPLIEKNIALKIVNTWNPQTKGTVISNIKTTPGIKSISVQNEVSLINITGKGLLGKIGVDARIFSSLSQQGINLGIISQGSSERGVSFIVSKKESRRAVDTLKLAFQNELQNGDVHAVKSIQNISVVTIIGQKVEDFSSSIAYLKQNNVEILLLNNTISGNNIGLVLRNDHVTKAINIIHSQIFGAVKTLNIAIVGKGKVGGSLVHQILQSQKRIFSKRNLNLKIFAVAGRNEIILDRDGIKHDWKEQLKKNQKGKNSNLLIRDFAQNNHLENLVLIDNTASSTFVENYIDYIESGFDLISSNKIANTQAYHKYSKIRTSLEMNKKEYLYETNVGAGLPIIDTIKVLHASGDNITRIRGVFSGSISYIFNTFSSSNKEFSNCLLEAVQLGLTEPDPREDLSGNDVARKLLILARELDLTNELEEVYIEQLIPDSLKKVKAEQFMERLAEMNIFFDKKRESLQEGEVLRYVADLHGNLQEDKGILTVKLETISDQNRLASLRNTDTLFEIYTETYKDQPITIVGPGAGAEVTARGVLGDLLRIAEKK